MLYLKDATSLGANRNSVLSVFVFFCLIIAHCNRKCQYCNFFQKCFFLVLQEEEEEEIVNWENCSLVSNLSVAAIFIDDNITPYIRFNVSWIENNNNNSNLDQAESNVLIRISALEGDHRCSFYNLIANYPLSVSCLIFFYGQPLLSTLNPQPPTLIA